MKFKEVESVYFKINQLVVDYEKKLFELKSKQKLIHENYKLAKQKREQTKL